MEIIKKIWRYAVGVVAAILAIIFINNQKKFGELVDKTEEKDEDLKRAEKLINKDVAEIEEEIKDLETEGVEDLTDDEAVTYWKKSLK